MPEREAWAWFGAASISGRASPLRSSSCTWLLERLSALEDAGEPRMPSVPPAALGSEEQRVVWVVLLGAPRDLDSTTRQAPAPERSVKANPAEIAASQGARWDLLADGAGVASLFDLSADRGERAECIARELSLAFPDRRMALAMGLGVMGRRAPVGHALDRAV